MWAMLGLGAFGFQLQEVPDNKIIVTTTRSHSSKLITDCVNAMEPQEVLRVGGAGNKVRRLSFFRRYGRSGRSSKVDFEVLISLQGKTFFLSSIITNESTNSDYVP